MTGSKSNINLYGADLAKAMKQDLKQEKIKGVTIRSKNRGYTDCFIITVTVEKSDMNTDYEVDEQQLWNTLHKWGVYIGEKRIFANDLYNEDRTVNLPKFLEVRKAVSKHEIEKYADNTVEINHYVIDTYKEFTEQFLKKLTAIRDIVGAYHYDHSNSMIDYFDTNFYYHIYTKAGKSWKGE